MCPPLKDVDFKALKLLSLAAALFVASEPVRAPDGGSIPLKFSREQLEFYEKQVQPLLAENCFKCHSHQAEKIKGSLVLDSREGLLKGGETGPAPVQAPRSPTQRQRAAAAAAAELDRLGVG